MHRKVCQLGQLVLIDTVEATCRADGQHDSKVEQVVLFQFVDRVGIQAQTFLVIETVALGH